MLSTVVITAPLILPLNTLRSFFCFAMALLFDKSEIQMPFTGGYPQDITTCR